MKVHLKIFADSGEQSDIVRVSFGIVEAVRESAGLIVYISWSRPLENVGT